MFERIKLLWGKLPAEVKVASYLAASYGLSAVITELAKVEVSNTWLAIGINIVLVFLKELKPRIDRLHK